MKLECCYCDRPATQIEDFCWGPNDIGLFCEFHMQKNAVPIQSLAGKKLLAKAIAKKLKHPDDPAFWDGIPF